MDEHEAIIREIAAKPLLCRDTTGGDLVYECLTCYAPSGRFDAMHRTESHDATCTWRRARTLYPDPLNLA